MLINDIINETTSGGIAIVAQPMGGMQKRPNPSVFSKSKKSKRKTNEQSQNYKVKHTPTGKTYKVTAMDQHSAKTKAAVQHGGRSASSRAEDDFEIVSP
jgi:hypothetical protein